MNRFIRRKVAPLAIASAAVIGVSLAAPRADASVLPTGGTRHRLIIQATTQIHSLALFYNPWQGRCYTMNFDSNPKFVAENQWWLDTTVNVDNKHTLEYYAFTGGNCGGVPYMSATETVPSYTKWGAYYLLRLAPGPCYGLASWGKNGCMPFNP